MTAQTRVRILQMAAVLTAPVVMWAFASGPPSGYTAAPGDHPGVACTNCHKAFAPNSQGGSVTVAFPNGLNYIPGQTETLSVTITDPAAVAYGFEMTARAESNPAVQQAGSFIAGQNQKIICAGSTPIPATGCANDGIQWIEQSQPLETSTFTVQWTAPSSNIGNVHFYIAANAAIDGPPSNGHIYAADYVLVPPPVAGTAPVINSGGVLNAASYASVVQSGSFVTIFGTNFTTSSATWDDAVVDGVLPTTLAGVTVAINGKPAPLSFVNGTQINALVPADSSVGPVNVVVSSAYGSSATVEMQLAKEAPAFFTFYPDDDRYIAAEIEIAGSPVSYEYLAPPDYLGESIASRAAKPGDTIILFGTGFGPTNPAVDPEYTFSGTAGTANPITVTIGGQTASVSFAGISGAPGLYQLSVVVPQVANGDQLVVATTADGVATTQKAYVAVQQ